MKTKIKTLSIEKIEKVAFILKAIGNPLKIGILDLLRINRELMVSELSEQLDAEQSLISHHLNGLKMKGILGSRREGKNIYYHLKLKEVVKVLDCMENCQLERF
ncbi:MAG: ArsR/SmtB family transcription factor [Cyclobacteriaceae bacterium]